MKKINTLQDNIFKLVDAVSVYFPSIYEGWKNRHLWNNIKTYCLFIGYPRSGHSLIGALLNAHPNIVIAHELADLKYIYLGFKRWQIYYLLMKKAELSAQKTQKLGGYNYYVPNQWQGKISKLEVIGDKQGEGTTLRIQSNKGYIEKLRKTIDVNIRFIHVVRNPYDNIITISQKTPRLDYDLEKSIQHYFSLCKTIQNFKKTLQEDNIFELKHEDFIDNSDFYLKEICTFLGVETTSDYLADCSKIVYKSPNKSRHSINWKPELIDLVQEKINNYSFLSDYTYVN